MGTVIRDKDWKELFLAHSKKVKEDEDAIWNWVFNNLHPYPFRPKEWSKVAQMNIVLAIR